MMRRALLLLTAAGCGLGYSPGDYSGGGGIVEAGTTADGAPLVPPPPLDPHLLVFAGERDGSDTTTNDVWSAPIDAKGDLGAFTYLQPLPLRTPLAAGTLAGGKLLVVTNAEKNRVLEYTDFAGGRTAGWRTITLPFPPESGYGQFFAGTTLVTIGGSIESCDAEGACSSSYESGIHPARWNGSAFPDGVATSPTKLPRGTSAPVVVRYRNFLYLWGDGDGPDARSKVFVGKIDESAGATAFAETKAIVDPMTNKAHTPATPMACAGEGHLFVAGGDKVDAVLWADIDETNGNLGAWKAGPKLPVVLKGAGCAVFSGALHLVGGISDKTRYGRVLRARIDGGKLGEWELSSGAALPAPRSTVLAFTY